MKFRTKIAIVVFSTVIAFYGIVGAFMSRSGQAVARGGQYAQVQTFDEVLNHIVRDYVDQPDLEKVRIGSLRGLAEGLDPYSAYLTPEQAKQYEARSSVGATGMVVSKVAGYAYVLTAFKNSPADQAGVRGGDFIEYIGKLPTRELSLYEIESLLSGKQNGHSSPSVEIRILHRGQPRKVTLTLAKVNHPAPEARLEEPGVGYIKVNSLTDGRANDIRAQLRDLTGKGAQKVVLDLRDASTGSLKEGVAVANLFVGTGTLARVIGKGGKETQAFEAEPSKVAFNGPLVVVIDRSTAGPAEIIAAAVRDNKRGEVVGERTFGAGSEQQKFELADGGALLLTTAKYAPGSGKPFMEEGVNPSVKVERPAEAEVVPPEGEDGQEPEDDGAAQPQAPAPKVEQPVEDVQLKRAIEILKQAGVKPQAAQKRAAVNLKSLNVTGGGVFEPRANM